MNIREVEQLTGMGAFLLSILRHTHTEEEPLWFTVILVAVVAALIICFFVLWYRSYRR